MIAVSVIRFLIGLPPFCVRLVVIHISNILDPNFLEKKDHITIIEAHLKNRFLSSDDAKPSDHHHLVGVTRALYIHVPRCWIHTRFVPSRVRYSALAATYSAPSRVRLANKL